MLKSPLWVRIYMPLRIYAQKANKESRHLHKMLLTQLRRCDRQSAEMTTGMVEGTTLFLTKYCTYCDTP